MFDVENKRSDARNDLYEGKAESRERRQRTERLETWSGSVILGMFWKRIQKLKFFKNFNFFSKFFQNFLNFFSKFFKNFFILIFF